MTPRSTVPDQRDRGDIYLVALGYFFHGKLTLKRSNLYDFSLCKFMHSVLRTSLWGTRFNHIVTMPLIVFLRNVFEIFNSIVFRNSVLVVYFQFRRAWSNKSKHNDLMYLESMPIPFSMFSAIKCYSLIALSASIWSKANTFRENRFNVSSVADKVLRISSYRLPIFHGLTSIPQAVPY